MIPSGNFRIEMMRGAIVGLAVLAIVISLPLAAEAEATGARSLLCNGKTCSSGCSWCKCGRCMKCASGYHSLSHWDKHCVRNCRGCHVDYCSDCDCDGNCKWCHDGYDLVNGWCEKHYVEPVYYEKPAKKPEPVYNDYGGTAKADATASGYNARTKTKTNCGGGSCFASSRSRSSG